MAKIALASKAKTPKLSKSAKPARPRASTKAPNPLTAPLTPAGLDAQVSAAAQQYAAPAAAEIAQERQTNRGMMSAIPSWFADYQAALGQATQRTAQAYAAAAGVQQNAANSTSALDAQQRAQQQQGMQTDAAARGAQVDPNVDARAQQAAMSRRSTMDAQTGLTAGQGAAQVAYGASRERAGAAQKVGALDTERRRGLKIDSAARDLATKTGAFAVTTRQKLIDTEHTKQLENKAFGLNVAKAKETAAADQAGVQIKRQAAAAKQALDAAKLTNDSAKIQIAQQNADASTARAQAYVTKRETTGAKKPTPTEKAISGHARSDIDYAMRQIKALRSHPQPKKVPVKDKDGKPIPNRFETQLGPNGQPVTGGAPPTGEQIRNALLNGAGPLKPVSNAAINAALKLIDEQKGGYLSAAQIKELRATYPGIHIGSLGYKTEHGRARVRRAPSSQLGRILESGAPIRATPPKR